MGCFYGNITLVGVDAEKVVGLLAERRAAVVSEDRRACVVYDQVCDDQDGESASALAASLSSECRCVAFLFVVHDDDICYYQVYDEGRLVDEYDSNPNYFDPNAIDREPPVGGDPQVLVRLFKEGASVALERMLRSTDYVFEHERHRDLVSELGLPSFGVTSAFASLEDPSHPTRVADLPILWATDAPEVEDPQTRRDRQLVEQLGPEDPSRPCQRDDCERGCVSMSRLCLKHHFEMIQGRPYPF